MASQSFILQGVTEDNHLDEVKKLIQLEAADRIIISVAFMNKAGFSLIEDLVKKHSAHLYMFVGIRNAITSYQGLEAAIGTGCKLYVVDTGSVHTIFHPKVYYARNDKIIRLIIGSANLTVGGLNGNVEASVNITLDRTEASSAALGKEISSKIKKMAIDYPDHVIRMKKVDDLKGLLAAGRVVDESVKKPPAPAGESSDRDSDPVPKMKLKTAKIKPTKPAPLPTGEEAPAPSGGGSGSPSAPGGENSSPPGAPAPVASPAAAPTSMASQKLVWESRPLSRRALDIPTGANTNRTGSMLFTKGGWQDIDQFTYFRDDLFGGLPWAPDTSPQKAHLERSEAEFRIVIKGTDYGTHTLRLTHNTNDATATYSQANSVTQIHWGDKRDLIAREDLLERTLRLYKSQTHPNRFVIEID